jgi:ParB family chromosome partitioning protein
MVEEEWDVTADEGGGGELRHLKIAEVVRDEGQPRREFRREGIEALAESVREHGVLQPIVVVRGGGGYEIVAGERRWRAAKLAGLATIPAIVRTVNEQNRLEMSLIENLQREDLNAIETATAYAKLKNQFSLSDAEIAGKVGKSEVAVKNTMRLLMLPEKVKKMMVKEGLSEGVMRPLIGMDEAVIEKVLPKIVGEGWSARKVEGWAAKVREGRPAAVRDVMGYRKEAARLGEKYGVRAEIKVNGVGGGRVVLRFDDERELRKLLGVL